MLDFLLPIWDPYIVRPLAEGLRLLANPFVASVGPGAAGAIAIVLFTILLRLVLMPLTLIQIRSQRHQMRIQPKLKELQRKFKGDREGMARAQMQLYKERGVNPFAPLSGCLPALIQYPILIALYYVFLGVAQHHTFGISHFLWIPDLNLAPLKHTFAGTPIPSPIH